MSKYLLVFGKDAPNLKEYEHYSVLGSFDTLQEAAKARKVSGDLVFFENKIVQDQVWLWPVEKALDRFTPQKYESYALRCIRAEKVLDPRRQVNPQGFAWFRLTVE